MREGSQKTVVSGPPKAPAGLLDRLRQSLESRPGRSNKTIARFFLSKMTDLRPVSHTGPPDSDSLPAKEGPYELGKIIATGGMGAIVSARDQNIHRSVALKVILNGADASPEHIQRLVTEARVTGQLEHPNIVPLHELGVTDDGVVYYTMRLVEGTTLAEVLDNIRKRDRETIRKYPLPVLLTIFQKVCDAVAFAHSRGVVHRDLKPENVMLGEFGEVMLMDWGLAKILADDELDEPSSATLETLFGDEDTFQTVDGQVKGTPRFMAPEQAEGKSALIDRRTDIYALGAILYNILTLHPPIAGDSMDEVLSKVASGTIMPPTSYNGSSTSRTRIQPAEAVTENIIPPILEHCPDRRVPSALSAVTMKTLARRQEDRYQTVAELQREIEAYQHGFATSAERASAFTLVWLLIKRHRTEFSLIAAAVVSLITVVAIFTSRVTLALNELKLAAPSFFVESKTLVDEIKFARALAKINYALSLTPEEPRFLALKGNIHQSMFQFREALNAYAKAKELDPVIPNLDKNIKLSQKLLKEKLERGSLSQESLFELRVAMQKQTRRAETIAINTRISRGMDEVYDSWQALVNKAGMRGKLTRARGGMLELEIRNKEANDLSPLSGMPLTRLNASDTLVDDLAPIELTPLTSLQLANTKVVSLTAVRRMPLRTLDIAGTSIQEISSLSGLPLNDLNLARTRITDLKSLRRLPLKFLRLDGCTNLTRLTELLECPTLENLIVPEKLQDAVRLLQLPNLKRIGTNWPTGGWGAVPTKEEFSSRSATDGPTQ